MMKTFTESDRYDIAGLAPESVIIDAGGYEGNWARLIVEKYGCHAHVFEPIKRFSAQIDAALKSHPKADRFHVYNLGIGANTRKETMGVKGDSSGIVADGPQETVSLVGIGDLLSNSVFHEKPVGALKLNVEGAEFEILEAMLAQDLMWRVQTIHVQFHNVIPRAVERMAYIKNMMLMTHRPIWDAEWVWSGWELK